MEVALKCETFEDTITANWDKPKALAPKSVWRIKQLAVNDEPQAPLGETWPALGETPLGDSKEWAASSSGNNSQPYVVYHRETVVYTPKPRAWWTTFKVDLLITSLDQHDGTTWGRGYTISQALRIENVERRIGYSMAIQTAILKMINERIHCTAIHDWDSNTVTVNEFGGPIKTSTQFENYVKDARHNWENPQDAPLDWKDCYARIDFTLDEEETGRAYSGFVKLFPYLIHRHDEPGPYIYHKGGLKLNYQEKIDGIIIPKHWYHHIKWTASDDLDPTIKY